MKKIILLLMVAFTLSFNVFFISCKENDETSNATTITFSSDFIFNKNGVKETFSLYQKRQINVPDIIVLKDDLSYTIDKINDFTVYSQSGREKKYKQVIWVYVDSAGLLHQVESGIFDFDFFENKKNVVLYMQYFSSDAWSPNY